MNRLTTQNVTVDKKIEKETKPSTLTNVSLKIMQSMEIWNKNNNEV